MNNLNLLNFLKHEHNKVKERAADLSERVIRGHMDPDTRLNLATELVKAQAISEHMGMLLAVAEGFMDTDSPQDQITAPKLPYD